jgi:hypothetical protein
MDRVTQRLWRGAEEPVLSVAEGTSAVLNYPCCSELFNHRSRQQDLLRYALGGHGYSENLKKKPRISPLRYPGFPVGLVALAHFMRLPY